MLYLERNMYFPSHLCASGEICSSFPVPRGSLSVSSSSETALQVRLPWDVVEQFGTGLFGRGSSFLKRH